MESVPHDARSNIGENEEDADDDDLNEEGPIFDYCHDEDSVTSDDDEDELDVVANQNFMNTNPMPGSGPSSYPRRFRRREISSG
ncbi:unnamed protein product [Cochlearia groenlandica]